ncbi:MAG: SDR family NAD(P)-dependent oxidoreductase [Acidimicrobiales bacterium]
MTDVPDRFRGRRALVTGASRGIGAAIAERLAAEGADVAIVARTLDHHQTLSGSLSETASRLEPYGGKVGVIVVDLADEDDRIRVVPEAVAALGGPIDILVNNAAAAMFAPVETFSLKRRRILFELNVHAPLDLSAAVVPAMRQSGRGWIVNLSSASTKQWSGPPLQLSPVSTNITLYGASKAALNRMTNGLAAELYGTGIRVNTVQPRGAVHSEGADALLGAPDAATNFETIEEMVEGAAALCDCDPDVTGRICVSLDLIDEFGLAVHHLNGDPLSSATHVQGDG